MNIIQATPSIHETKRIVSSRTIAHAQQKERIFQPSPSVIVTLNNRLPEPIVYNKDGFIESATDCVDESQNASDKVAKEAIQDENARMAASISANSAYAYAVSLLYVNTATISYVVAKMAPKIMAGIQPVAPVSAFGTASQLPH